MRIVTVESSAETAAGGDVRNHPIDQALGVRQEGLLLGCLMQREQRQGRPGDVAC